MKDILKKGIYTGLGLALATKDKINEIVEDVKKESDISEKEGEVLYKKLVEKSESYKTEAEKFIEEIVETTLAKLNIPTAKDIEIINAKLDKIEAFCCEKDNEIEKSEENNVDDKLEPNEG